SYTGAVTQAGNVTDAFDADDGWVVRPRRAGAALGAVLPARAARRIPAEDGDPQGRAAAPVAAAAGGARAQRQAAAALARRRHPLAGRLRGAGPGQPALRAVAAGQRARADRGPRAPVAPARDRGRRAGGPAHGPPGDRRGGAAHARRPLSPARLRRAAADLVGGLGDVRAGALRPAAAAGVGAPGPAAAARGSARASEHGARARGGGGGAGAGGRGGVVARVPPGRGNRAPAPPPLRRVRRDAEERARAGAAGDNCRPAVLSSGTGVLA